MTDAVPGVGAPIRVVAIGGPTVSGIGLTRRRDGGGRDRQSVDARRTDQAAGGATAFPERPSGTR